MKLLSDQVYILAGFAGVLLLILTYFYLYNHTLKIENNYEQHLFVQNKEELLNVIIKYSDACILKYYPSSQEKKCYKLIISLKKPLNLQNLPLQRNIKNIQYYLKYDIMESNKLAKILIIAYKPNLQNNKAGVYIYEIQ